LNLVREHIAFKRGQDPHEALGIGNDRPFQHGDKILFSKGGKKGVVLIYDSTPGSITGETFFYNDTGIGTYKIPLDVILSVKAEPNDGFYSWTRINESSAFKRGQDPHKSLQVGDHKPFEVGDEVYIKPNYMRLYDRFTQINDSLYRREMSSLPKHIGYTIESIIPSDDGFETDHILCAFEEMQDDGYYKNHSIDFYRFMLSRKPNDNS